jgi:hypothetical protein
MNRARLLKAVDIRKQSNNDIYFLSYACSKNVK